VDRTGAALRFLGSNDINPGWNRVPRSNVSAEISRENFKRMSLYLKEPLGWNHGLGFALIAAGAFFILHKWS
jgi:hypothetical protein